MYKAKITKEQYNALKLTLSNDEMHPTMNYVHYDSDNERFVSTNGKQLVFFPYEAENMEDTSNLWELYKSGKGKNTEYALIPVNVDHMFPNYEQVFIPHDATRADQIAHAVGKGAESKSRFLYLLTQKIGPVNFDYLKPLENVGMVVAHTFGENKAMRIDTEQFTYVFMPMHKDSVISAAEENARYKV